MNRSRREKTQLICKLLLLIGIFAVICVFGVVILGRVDRQLVVDTEEDEDIEVVQIGGSSYIPKKNIETYLFMGVDAEGKVKKATDYGQSGQCDTLILLVRDLSKGTYQLLPIDRNTMTEVKSLNLEGEYLATTTNQLAYAHAEGDGLETSCENVVDAVSNLLGEQTIDGYAALNMGAIKVINSLVGGVTVTIEDDFSQCDPTLKMGETVTLTDEQAESYVRGRMTVGDGENESRIRRQDNYMEAMKPLFQQKCKENSDFPLTAYDALQEYMVTNISKQKFSKIMMLVAKEKSEGTLHIEGTNEIGKLDFEEFRPDEESLTDVITTLFYKKYE